MKKTAIIGGGPAGMSAAIAALRSGQQADLYDQNEKLGKKLYITGKGRCNLTNHCDISEFLTVLSPTKISFIRPSIPLQMMRLWI